MQEQILASSMAQTSSILNADFVVLLHNGSAGAILTSVNRVTRGKLMEIMSVNILKLSFLSVLDLKRVL